MIATDNVIKQVAQAKRYTKLVECYRSKFDDDGVFALGYVVDASEQFVLIHNVDQRITLDGYTMLRIADLTQFDVEVEQAQFIEKALAIRKKEIKRPVLVDLTDMETMLFSIEQNYPLVAIYREDVDPDACWIGSIDSITDKTVTLNEMDPDAKWNGSKRFRLDEITRIDFDGGYETALALVAKL
ncbi:MAG: hypothetical protein COA73_11920 [Candidatus Hydrogenedentota bacterium]|nr:MAG: hypothetical protein COA73_11920 [Candidatus Hydrogenedentota bacterium]